MHSGGCREVCASNGYEGSLADFHRAFFGHHLPAKTHLLVKTIR